MVQQTKWVDRRWNFNFDVGLFPIIYSRLQGTIPRLRQLFDNADESKLVKSGSGWSAKEHLGHLVDLEELWWKRWLDYKYSKEEMTPADITNRRTTEANHNATPTKDLLDSFIKEREKILEAIVICDEKMLLRTSLHPRLKTPMRLVDYLYFVAEHDDHHVAIIEGFI
ncbi:MAG: DinB family protein [Chitinophagaceae bacterium]|nr:DinB family protein [Chitinophagaceae bacterium]